jgi:hypothetical protein
MERTRRNEEIAGEPHFKSEFPFSEIFDEKNRFLARRTAANGFAADGVKSITAIQPIFWRNIWIIASGKKQDAKKIVDGEPITIYNKSRAIRRTYQCRISRKIISDICPSASGKNNGGSM